MKPAECRRLAEVHDENTLSAAATALAEEQKPIIEIAGADEGEQLTHVLLALRIRARVDGGEELRDAFRAVMADVRTVVSNT